MNLNDPIGDMLTRIRNGQSAGKQAIEAPYSKERASVLDVLKEEGYIRAYDVEDVRKGIKKLIIQLKYTEGVPAIEYVARVSTPGRRVYSAVDGFKPVRSGLGISIISTSKGIMTDVQARQAGIGGEVICQIF